VIVLSEGAATQVSPSAMRTPGEAGDASFLLSMVMLLIAEPIANHDLTELFVARQQLIERY
jgi:hypothetical protein